jgi:hypothetical protein
MELDKTRKLPQEMDVDAGRLTRQHRPAWFRDAVIAAPLPFQQPSTRQIDVRPRDPVVKLGLPVAWYQFSAFIRC